MAQETIQLIVIINAIAGATIAALLIADRWTKDKRYRKK